MTAGRCGGYRQTLKLNGHSEASRRPSAASRDLSGVFGRMTLICELEVLPVLRWDLRQLLGSTSDCLYLFPVQVSTETDPPP